VEPEAASAPSIDRETGSRSQRSGTLGATWLGAIAVVYYAELLDNDVSENVGWALLGVGTVGFVLTLAAFTAVRTRGELTLAWAALALALGFVALGGGPFLFYGLSGE
jgi:hypothetical protein